MEEGSIIRTHNGLNWTMKKLKSTLEKLKLAFEETEPLFQSIMFFPLKEHGYSQEC